MDSRSTPQITVVGTGISGLSLGYFLKKSFGDGIRLTLLEAAPRTGGTVRTVVKDGFQVEAGPSTLLDNRPDTRALISSLGLDGKLIRSIPENKGKFIWAGGKLRKAPEGPLSFLFSDLLSPLGKLRLLSEPFIPKGNAENESLDSFFTRRMGAEAVSRLIDPVFSGIYAGSLRQLGAEAVVPKLYTFERRHGSIVKGFIASAFDRSACSDQKRKRGELISFGDGLSVLTEALTRELQREIITDAAVRNVEYDKGNRKYTVHFQRTSTFRMPHSTDRLILAAPAYASEYMLGELDEKLARALSQIPYAPVHMVALGFPADAPAHSLKGFGFLLGREEREKLLGSIWSSSVFPGRAPEGKILIQSLLGGADHPEVNDLTDDELIAYTCAQLRQILGIESEPVFRHIFRYGRAIPQYTTGHTERLAVIEERLHTHPGLYLTGNALRGTGLNDCVEQSKRLAEKISAELSDRTSDSPALL